MLRPQLLQHLFGRTRFAVWPASDCAVFVTGRFGEEANTRGRRALSSPQDSGKHYEPKSNDDCPNEQRRFHTDIFHSNREQSDQPPFEQMRGMRKASMQPDLCKEALV